MQKMDLMAGLHDSLEAGFSGYRVTPHHDGLTTEIKNRQTNVFRPGTMALRYEHDFVFELA